MIKLYLAPFIIAAILAGGLTYIIKKIAQKFGAIDLPSPRKIHTHPIPRMGGLAIAVSVFILAFGYNLISSRMDFSNVSVWLFDQKLFGVFLGSLVIVAAGIYDDRKGLSALKKLFWQVVAAAIVVAFGISISYIRLPGGNLLDLNSWIIPINFFNQSFNFVVWGDLLTLFWIVLMINTLNFLDGLDGLAGGISLIAALVLSFSSFVLGQYPAALLSLILAGAILGFLPWNFHPAKIFLGDTGSMFLGFILGVLAVISGGKLATAFLVLGIPLLDVGWVALRRIFSGQSPFSADKLHLHHRLLSGGLSQRQAVISLYALSAFFGILAIYANNTDQKGQIIFYLIILMVALAIALIIIQYRKKKRENV